MNEKLPDEHSGIKSFKCIECQMVLPESSRYQDTLVCVNCVAEAGYQATEEEADNTEDAAQQDAHFAGAETEVFTNMFEQKDEEDIIKAMDAVAVEKNTKYEQTMGVAMIEETDWVTIAAGEFMMGSLDADDDSDEQLHDVAVPGFKMLKTAVTFEQFDVFCEETGKGKYNDCKWGRGNRPVVYVTYWDAVDYAKWLSDVTGWRCRLPTEAEWEYACRAGTETTFNTGNTITTAQANYDGDSPHLLIPTGISRHKTMPTGTFPGNAWGLFEMHGNVCEWCASEYDPCYNGSEQIDGSIDRSNNVPRVLRGGGWNSRLETLRSAARMQSKPENRSNEWGFRLVRID